MRNHLEHKSNEREGDPLAPFIDEHQCLIRVCDRVRKGLSSGVEIERIRSYVDWFKEAYLEPHFKYEEHVILSSLGKNARVKRVLANHRRILKLLSCSCDDLKVLNLLEEELSTFIRFEERVLFREFNDEVAVEKPRRSEQHSPDTVSFCDSVWKDPFWKGERY